MRRFVVLTAMSLTLVLATVQPAFAWLENM